ncbi:AraC family transcriptional regulator [Spirochaetia bacterium 38H-sp]|uniref:AraC family transcriptional regulator n=1 Tax=Rarispira pelagica TaxID=3141764 RepID=A0ABU9UBR1_9SPIR
MLPVSVKIEDETCNIRFIKNPHAITNKKRHFHESWEILYVASGSRTFFHQRATYKMNQGSIALIPPGILHRSINDSRESCELYAIYIIDQNDHRFSSLFPILVYWAEEYEPVLQFDNKTRYQIEALLSSIGTELLKKEQWYTEAVWSHLTILIANICRYAAEKQGTQQQPMDSRVTKIIEWLNTHYHEKINLIRAAKEVAISPAYLSKLFHKVTKVNFQEYLSYIRIQHACKMLATTREPVYNIAEKCGFGSVTQFGRVFLSFTGEKPMEYRKRTNQHYS